MIIDCLFHFGSLAFKNKHPSQYKEAEKLRREEEQKNENAKKLKGANLKQQISEESI